MQNSHPPPGDPDVLQFMPCILAFVPLLQGDSYENGKDLTPVVRAADTTVYFPPCPLLGCGSENTECCLAAFRCATCCYRLLYSAMF